MKLVKSVLVIGLSTMLLLSGSALAAPQCFQPFSGVYLWFNRPVTMNATALNGRVFGALSSCDNLSSWPLVGSIHRSKKDGIVVAFRAFTVDANNCGAVDWIGTMSGKPLSGPFELFNQRTDFGNTGTWTQVACPTPPERHSVAPAGRDMLGNFSK